MSPTVVQVLQLCRDAGGGLRYDVKITLLAAGLIFLLALVLGVWKYRQIMVAEDHRAHVYVDIAHRAALLYSFATLLIAAFVEFSAWPAWVNLTAAMVAVFFFVAAILSYIGHGLRRDTENQFEKPDSLLTATMVALIVGEIGGFAVLLAGFIVGQFF
jgi:preprotein translocase subunit SecG